MAGSPSNPGLNKIHLMDKASLLTTPVDPVGVGYRGAAGMQESGYKQITDYQDGKRRHMRNFKVEFESLQPTLFMLKKFISWVNQNCDVQVQSVPQGGGNPDVYQLVGNYLFGLDFEYSINGDKRSLKGILERAFQWATAQTFKDAADSTSPVSIGGGGRGEDINYYRAPFFLAFEAPAATSLAAFEDIINRSFSIKTKSKKIDLSNISRVDYLTFELMLKVVKASVADVITVMSKVAAPSVVFKEQNNGTYYDKFSFASGVLMLDDEFEDKDDDRLITLKFSRSVLPSDITYTLGDGVSQDGGGGVADTTGVNGGTMNIG